MLNAPEKEHEIIAQLKRTSYKKLHIVIGVVNDKDLGKILAMLPKNASYYFCTFDLPRAMSAEELHVAAREFGLKGSNMRMIYVN